MTKIVVAVDGLPYQQAKDMQIIQSTGGIND
jgi:hypothetical protein